MKIEPLGSFFDISDDGYICNMGHRDNIQPPWLDMVEAIKQVYLTHCADQLHSIYIRGSVARGLAIPNVSDVDSFAVTKPNAALQDTSKAEISFEHLSQKFPFATGVEFGLTPYEEVFERATMTSVILKTQSVCIYGDDLQYKIEPYKPNREVIDQAFFLTKKLATYEEETATEEDLIELKEWCTWLMKGIVRSGFELVIEEEGAYTRDLYPCYETFIKYYPDKQAAMYQALTWSINPTADRRQVLPFLQGFGQWLSQQIEMRYPHRKRLDA